MWASSQGRTDVVNELLSQGADVSLQDYVRSDVVGIYVFI